MPDHWEDFMPGTPPEPVDIDSIPVIIDDDLVKIEPDISTVETLINPIAAPTSSSNIDVENLPTLPTSEDTDLPISVPVATNSVVTRQSRRLLLNHRQKNFNRPENQDMDTAVTHITLDQNSCKTEKQETPLVTNYDDLVKLLGESSSFPNNIPNKSNSELLMQEKSIPVKDSKPSSPVEDINLDAEFNLTNLNVDLSQPMEQAQAKQQLDLLIKESTIDFLTVDDSLTSTTDTNIYDHEGDQILNVPPLISNHKINKTFKRKKVTNSGTEKDLSEKWIRS